mmetsp:Transcript_21195/g.50345  ORF Transcript_21195/g.50345 Transcript_21195/m.50345 type:complete len:500 (-) Transcript_21195:280-1779(-)
MNCGIGLQSPPVESLNDLLSFIGLGKEGPGTPSTFGLEQDDDEIGSVPHGAAFVSASRQLTYAPCLSSRCSPETAGTTAGGGVCNTPTNGKLTCAPLCLPTGSSYAPATSAGSNDGLLKNRAVEPGCDIITSNEEMKFYYIRCNPQTCRETADVCVDCTGYIDHRTTGGDPNMHLPTTRNTPDSSAIEAADLLNPIVKNKKSSRKRPQRRPKPGKDCSEGTHVPLHELTIRIKKEVPLRNFAGAIHRGTNAGRSNTQREQQQQQHSPTWLRTNLSLLTESSDGDNDQHVSACETGKTKARTSGPSRTDGSDSRQGNGFFGNPCRYNMGDDGGEYLHLTHRMIDEHSRRSAGSSECSNHSHSSHTTASSRRRWYDMTENDLDRDRNHRAGGSHRRSAGSGRGRKNRTAGGGDDDEPRSSSFFFSLPMRGRTTAPEAERILPSVSFETRGSASTKRRDNSTAGSSRSSRSSLSSSSRSYLQSGTVPEPKKSWFRRRYEQRE